MLNAFFCFALFTYAEGLLIFPLTSERSSELLISAAGLTVNGRSGLWHAARPPRRPELPGSLPRRLHSLVVRRSPSWVPLQRLPWGDSSLLSWGSYSEKPGLNSVSLTLRRLQKKVRHTHDASPPCMDRCTESVTSVCRSVCVIRFHSSRLLDRLKSGWMGWAQRRNTFHFVTDDTRWRCRGMLPCKKALWVIFLEFYFIFPCKISR